MGVRNPEELNETLFGYVMSGDLEAALDLYEPDASFVSDGQVVVGTDAIRGIVEWFISTKPRLTIEPREVVLNGDLALTRASWNLVGTSPEGDPLEISGRSVEVIRRQPDGTWRFVIDDPFGGD